MSTSPVCWEPRNCSPRGPSTGAAPLGRCFNRPGRPETAPEETAVLTVGSIAAGTKSNVISDHAVLQLNVRTYSDATRTAILDAIDRIVVAECQASRSPKDPTSNCSSVSR